MNGLYIAAFIRVSRHGHRIHLPHPHHPAHIHGTGTHAVTLVHVTHVSHGGQSANHHAKKGAAHKAAHTGGHGGAHGHRPQKGANHEHKGKPAHGLHGMRKKTTNSKATGISLRTYRAHHIKNRRDQGMFLHHQKSTKPKGRHSRRLKGPGVKGHLGDQGQTASQYLAAVNSALQHNPTAALESELYAAAAHRALAEARLAQINARHRGSHHHHAWDGRSHRRRLVHGTGAMSMHPPRKWVYVNAASELDYPNDPSASTAFFQPEQKPHPLAPPKHSHLPHLTPGLGHTHKHHKNPTPALFPVVRSH